MERIIISKLDDELKGFGKGVVNFKETAVNEFNSHPPPPFLIAIIDSALVSEPLKWFLAGMSLEALGLGLQVWFKMDCYPLLDALFAGLIAGLLFYKQRKPKAVVADAGSVQD